jgi:flagellar basal-body rod protein FlgB
MTGTIDSMFGIHGAALALREERLSLIASNIANADTPNYRARDIDFDAAMRQAAGAPAADALGTTNAAHYANAAPAGPSGTAQVYRVPMQASLDGNTVDTDFENAAFARAALEYRASLSFVEGRMRTLMTAIGGE